MKQIRLHLDQAERDKIVRLYRDTGLPVSVIAERMGRSDKTVVRLLRAAGITVKPRRQIASAGGGSFGGMVMGASKVGVTR